MRGEGARETEGGKSKRARGQPRARGLSATSRSFSGAHRASVAHLDASPQLVEHDVAPQHMRVRRRAVQAVPSVRLVALEERAELVQAELGVRDVLGDVLGDVLVDGADSRGRRGGLSGGRGEDEAANELVDLVDAAVGEQGRLGRRSVGRARVDLVL